MHSDASELRLRDYYYFVQISGILVIGFFAFVISAYPTYFSFLLEPILISKLMFGMLCVHTLCFLLQELFHKKSFYALSRYTWILFFAALVYLSGGVHSQFLFVLFFPLLTAGTDLRPTETKYVGIALVLLFASFIFGTGEALTQELIVKHAARTLLFAVAAYYLHKMVKETLLQKYEKEETKRKFVELIELDQVKSDFITVASHQLRTPLSGVKWALGSLSSDGALPPAAKEVVDQSLAAVDKSIGIINELMSASENKIAGLTLVKSTLSIHELVGDVIREMKNFAEQSGVTLIVEEKTAHAIQGDKEKLAVVLLNILDNAIRYSPKGTVSIHTREEGHSLCIVIQDSGMGIGEEDLPHVFDRLFRAKEAIDRSPNETGLGLYIAKKIVEKHQGSIELSSQKGKGTKVTIRLPL